MSRFESPETIGGLGAVRAVRRAGKTSHEARTRPTRTRLPATEKKADAEAKPGAPIASRIGRTARPASYELECYDCGYAFKLTGRLSKTFCPKCKKELEVGDYVIDKEWFRDITTVGKIEVKANGKMKGTRFLARDMILAGDIEESEGYVFGCLELQSGARFDPAKLKIKDVCIGAGSRLSLKRKLTCRNLDVRGELRARVHAEGVLTIKPGGLLRGDITAAHFVVEEGGGLKAKVRTGDAVPEPGK